MHSAKPDKCAAFSLTHGLVQYKKVTDDSSQSQRIYYACEADYKTFEDTWWGETSCSQGVFSYTPQCISKYDCGRFPTIPHGELNALTPNKVYRHREWAAFQCDLGYKAERYYITCENGQWTTGECKRDICGPPPRVENAVVASYDQETFIMSATFQCREHFTIPKHPKMFCINKKWDPAPTCEMVPSTCLKPQKEIINGSVLEPHKLKDYYGKMQTVPYKCLEGFSFEREKYAQCIGEKWTYPNCIQSRACGSPPSFRFAKLTKALKDTYRHGESIKYTCQDYYKMEGSAHMSCNQGTWTGSIKCLSFCLLMEDDMDDRKIQPARYKKQSYRIYHGNYIVFKCQDQRQPKRGSVDMEQQCNNGVLHLPVCR
ncbi:coagulation factor XIII B chain-like isoform X2 [Hoplias malabaricus]|uniref:coagulation factor XIII B chain-like isoform X2 n=1 Tax=Hoplias malabaricus TaxID=27720 RepID=UPI0034619CFC